MTVEKKISMIQFWRAHKFGCVSFAKEAERFRRGVSYNIPLHPHVPAQLNAIQALHCLVFPGHFSFVGPDRF